MCTYTCAIFECKHEIWGVRVNVCPVGKTPLACKYRVPHPLATVQMPRKCHKCMETERRIARVRDLLDTCRESFRQKWPERAALSADKESTSASSDQPPASTGKKESEALIIGEGHKAKV